MSDYPQRVEKSENIYRLWDTGEGDMGELAIGLYNLTADYKSLWDDYTKLEEENERLRDAKVRCPHCVRLLLLTDEGRRMMAEQDALKEGEDVQPTS